jgi:hypothetical protein
MTLALLFLLAFGPVALAGEWSSARGYKGTSDHATRNE